MSFYNTAERGGQATRCGLAQTDTQPRYAAHAQQLHQSGLPAMLHPPLPIAPPTHTPHQSLFFKFVFIAILLSLENEVSIASDILYIQHA